GAGKELLYILCRHFLHARECPAWLVVFIDQQGPNSFPKIGMVGALHRHDQLLPEYLSQAPILASLQLLPHQMCRDRTTPAHIVHSFTKPGIVSIGGEDGGNGFTER